jgi:FAD/FMN-containing dehydrogenase
MAEPLDTLTTELVAILGAGALHVGDDARERVSGGWARVGVPLLLARPASTEQVAQTVRACAGAGIPVVALGGRTGVVAGNRVDGAVALSLDRMSQIESIDVTGRTMTVGAGCIIQQVCEAAEARDLMFPLDLGARGSATVGGAIATNAGGNRVIRYGMMREMVLGLEVVLADGTVVSSMNTLIKNNAGYDIKQLFIGTEGTLGIVTRAVLRLRAAPRSENVAFVAVPSFAALTDFQRFADQRLGGSLSAFEVMWPEFYELVTTPPATGRAPLPAGHAHYVLIESLGGDDQGDGERFERILAEALEQGLIADAAIAKSQAERNALWALRDDVEQAGRNRPVYSFDVSLPVIEMEDYLAEIRAALPALGPRPSLVVFGHLGDGNLHLMVGVGDSGPAVRAAVSDLVYGGLQSRGGSISAEHGIGLEKRAYLDRSRNPEEIALMLLLKRSLDPANLLNPGKVLNVPAN